MLESLSTLETVFVFAGLIAVFFLIGFLLPPKKHAAKPLSNSQTPCSSHEEDDEDEWQSDDSLFRDESVEPSESSMGYDYTDAMDRTILGVD